MSSLKLSATRRRHERELDDKQTKAYKEIQSLLDGWTSPQNPPMVRTVPPLDDAEWMEQQLEPAEDEEMSYEDVDEDKLPLRTPPRQARVLERAETPVMSNSSKKKMPTPTIEEKEPVLLRNIPIPRQYVYECQRYHDALKQYLVAKRRIAEKVDDVQRDRALKDDSNYEDAMETDELALVFQMDPHILQEETNAEAAYLRALSSLCWERDEEHNMASESRREGNFWLLLATLRLLGVPSLLWDDDEATVRQNKAMAYNYMDKLAQDVETTPHDLLQALYSPSDAPLVLLRRQKIFKWLQECFQQVVPQGATRPRQGNILPQSQLFKQGLYETDKDKEILKDSLALILAGRLEDARTLARESGLAWRAASWNGGGAYGYYFDDQGKKRQSGNTMRPLWKRMMWKKSEDANSKAGIVEDGAIAAILSNHLANALDNAALRSWEKGLWACWSCFMARTEDELLHAHNNVRRKMRPPFPGTQFEGREREHLKATATLSSYSEKDIVAIPRNSPYVDMSEEDPFCQAMASFINGKSAIVNYLGLASDMNEVEESNSILRFFTHLFLYLDSLTDSVTPIAVPDISELKDDLLLRYLKHLASREELWHQLILYASFLSENLILEHLPRLLCYIESDEERKVIVRQMRELLPRFDLHLMVMKRLVQTILDEKDDVEDTDVPTELDTSKMKTTLWFTYYEDHVGYALFYINAVLRQFLLADKRHAAYVLVDDIRPTKVYELAFGLTNLTELIGDDEMIDSTYARRIEDAQIEHQAYQSFLDAVRKVDFWHETLFSTDSHTRFIDDELDSSLLTTTEATIAKSMKRRELTELKRKSSQVIVNAATEAQQGLLSVLRHEGGWLYTDDEDDIDGMEDKGRRQDMNKIRVKVLPDCVMQYYDICMETANWMERSLVDATEQLDTDFDEAISLLDDQGHHSDRSPMSPKFWTNEAIKLAELLSSDQYAIQSSFGTSDLKELLRKLADAAAKDLFYSTRRK